jgi:mono/diheme cytochrome c family protein
MTSRTKWTLGTAIPLAALAFLLFLYYTPPFFVFPPETFSKPMAAAPPVSDIEDPALRAIAERGRYIVMTAGCIACHGIPTIFGPDMKRYLAGGPKFVNARATVVGSNLTPDPENGIGGRSDTDLTRVLVGGTFPDGHAVTHTIMPWASYSHWTEEDRMAVIVYLRHLTPVKHQIPPPAPPTPLTHPGAIEQAYGSWDYGATPK